MTTDALPASLETHWPTIESQLLAGTYRPQPVRRVEIPKPGGGGVRKLGIPTVLDRVIHQAIAKAQTYIEQGDQIVVDIDLEKFFDRVNHDILMSLAAKRETDKRRLKILRAFLTAGILEDGLVSRNEEGTPQGGPLSPLMSNLMLDVLDRELEQRGLPFARDADDCNIYVKSQRAGQRVMEGITRFLTRKLKLKVNQEKSAVGKPSKRKFLGFRFQVRHDQVKRRIAPKSIVRFKDRIREITRRNRGVSFKARINELSRYILGPIHSRPDTFSARYILGPIHSRMAKLFRLLPDPFRGATTGRVDTT